MKAFLSMIAMAGFFFLVFGRSQATEGETVGARMQRHINSTVAVAHGLDFDCNHISFAHVAGSLGVELYWDTLIVLDTTALAFAVDNEIHMQVGVCHYAVKEIFFHELGHILMGHCSDRQNISYSDVMEEEADYLSMYVMDELRLNPRWPRFRKLNNH